MWERHRAQVPSLRSATPRAYRPRPLGFHGGFVMLARLFPSSASGDQRKGQGRAEAPPSHHVAGPPGKAPIRKPLQSGLAGTEDGANTQEAPRASGAPVRCHPLGVALRSRTSAPGLAMGWAQTNGLSTIAQEEGGLCLVCLGPGRVHAPWEQALLSQASPGRWWQCPHGPGLLKMPPTSYIFHPQAPRTTALCPRERPCGWSSF